MILVGATNENGVEAPFSQFSDYVTVFAGGRDIYIASDPSNRNPFEVARGTSFAAPQVAALAGYLKKLPSQWETQCTFQVFQVFILIFTLPPSMIDSLYYLVSVLYNFIRITHLPNCKHLSLKILGVYFSKLSCCVDLDCY